MCPVGLWPLLIHNRNLSRYFLLEFQHRVRLNHHLGPEAPLDEFHLKSSTIRFLSDIANAQCTVFLLDQLTVKLPRVNNVISGVVIQSIAQLSGPPEQLLRLMSLNTSNRTSRFKFYTTSAILYVDDIRSGPVVPRFHEHRGHV